MDQLVDFKMDRNQFLDYMAQNCKSLAGGTGQVCECTVVISPEHCYMTHDSGIKSKEQLASLLFDAANTRAILEVPNSTSSHDKQNGNDQANNRNLFRSHLACLDMTLSNFHLLKDTRF